MPEGERTEVITIRGSRFNQRYLEEMFVRVSELYELRMWVRTNEPNWLKREFTVTLRGPSSQIAAFVRAVRAVRGGGGVGDALPLP